MTLPNERARALRWAGEFIKELSNAGELSEKRRQEAQAILRHYPSEAETKFFEQVSLEKIEPAVVHPSPTADSQNPGRFTHLYGVLTVQDMAEHLNCSPYKIYDRAIAGEFLFLSSSDRVDDRRYPAFQLGVDLFSLSKVTVEKLALA